MLALLVAAAVTVPAAEQAAIFTAAGFKLQGKSWKTGYCDGMETESYEPGTIDTYRDLNGDGRSEAIVIEGGAICYGNTGAHFWLMSKQSSGSWTVLYDSLGIPEFLTTRGANKMPDMSVGGPGGCFPVLRWNGKAYALNRHEYDGKPCQPKR
jgi:hypothetical protein